MDEAAFVPEEEEEEEEAEAKPRPKAKQQPAPATPKSKLDQLRQQLKEAIEKENYEKAAQLRDEIQKLEASEN
jgi:protein-arginine kinase activator protein McsA